MTYLDEDYREWLCEIDPEDLRRIALVRGLAEEIKMPAAIWLDEKGRELTGPLFRFEPEWEEQEEDEEPKVRQNLLAVGYPPGWHYHPLIWEGGERWN